MAYYWGALISPRWGDGSAPAPTQQHLLSAEEEAAAAEMLRRLSIEETSLEQLQTGLGSRAKDYNTEKYALLSSIDRRRETLSLKNEH